MAQNKFRPALTEPEIRYLISKCDTEQNELLKSTAATISARFKVFLVKAEVGLVSPAFASVGRQSVEQRLGLDVENYSEVCYQKWKMHPELCSESQIKTAELYAYENDLMTPEQEQEYEAR